MPVATLPFRLRPQQPPTLERLGAHCDGGYLIEPGDLAIADGLISMGVATDWSFEKDFARRKAVPVRAYDGSLSLWYLMGRATRDMLVLKPAAAITESVSLVADYFRFFHRQGRVRHIRNFVGPVEFSYRRSAASSISLGDALAEIRAAGSTRPFLKIDIEGSEYALLDQLVASAPVTAGLAIEFHDCARRMDEILSFVARYPLRLVHVHANTYTVAADEGVPGALELTFSSTAQAAITAPMLPHPADRPNDGSAEEVVLRFA